VQRAVRVSQVWGWLPAFRTVAETEHLPTAAKVLELSPSALSRSVKLLEACLGEPLFTRDRRQMRLNRAGQLLLVAVRDAMRRIDDGIEQASTPSLDRIRIAGPLEWLQLVVLPAIRAHASTPAVIVDIEDISPADLPRALLRGEIDLAVSETIGAHEQLTHERIGEVHRAVCWSTELATDEGLDVAAYVSEGADEVAPRDRGRVALRTQSLALALEACKTGRMRAVLPAVVARAHGLQTRAESGLRVSQLDLVQRARLAETPIAPLVALIRAQAQAIFR
jgi:DNA-binding transcriptional LysR family regulator